SAILGKSIQLSEQLVQCLLDIRCVTLVSLPAYRIKLVNEHNRWRLRPSIAEQIAHSLGSDTNIDLVEFAARHEKEWYPGFTSNSSSKERFPCSGRPNQENTLRQFSTET